MYFSSMGSRKRLLTVEQPPLNGRCRSKGECIMNRMTAAVSVVFLLVGGAFFWEKNRVQAMSVQIHVKDLPEEGVRIIAPYDLSFDKRAESFLKGPASFVDRVKPFSVIVE